MKSLIKKIKAGSHLFHENDYSRELYIIKSGSLKVYRISNGREINLTTLQKGAVLGEMALIDGKPRSASAKALTDSEVIIISADSFHEKIKNVPPWFMSIIKMTTHKIRQANLRLQNITNKNQNAKIVICLFYLFRSLDTEKHGLNLQLVQTRLINLLGLTHQNIVQVLDILHKNNIIAIKNENVFILDYQRFKEYSEFLRLLIRNSFEKFQELTSDLKLIVSAMVKSCPDIIENTDNIEIPVDKFLEIAKETNITEIKPEILEDLRDRNLLFYNKELSGNKQEFLYRSVKINNSEWKKVYLHTKFSHIEQIL